MPNYCDYEMKVKGKQKDVEEFIKIIQVDYHIDKHGNCDCDRHFWRVFEADVYEENYENDTGYAIIAGYCAWSVYSCMCDGEGTYNGYELHGGGTTLEKESKRLNLTIEVFSAEAGCEFSEHFIFVNGEWLVNDCVEYKEFSTLDYENVDELNAENETSFTQEEFEHNDTLHIGGIPWIFTI